MTIRLPLEKTETAAPALSQSGSLRANHVLNVESYNDNPVFNASNEGWTMREDPDGGNDA